MTVFHIVLVLFLVLWLIHYWIWGIRVARELNRLRSTIQTLHPNDPVLAQGMILRGVPFP